MVNKIEIVALCLISCANYAQNFGKTTKKVLKEVLKFH